MPTSPSLMVIMVAIVGGVLVVVLALVGAIWMRLRALPVRELARQVEELGRRQRVLEDHWAQVGSDEARRAEGQPGLFPKGPGAISIRPASSTFRVDVPEGPADAGPTLIAIPNLAAPPQEETESAAAELGQRFGAIWDLADEGASPEAIARRTGQPVGQVELILALRRQLANKSGGPRPR